MDPELAEAVMPAKAPYLEMPMWVMDNNGDQAGDEVMIHEKSLKDQAVQHPLEYAESIQSPGRLIKSHLPISHLPSNLLDKAKVVYVCRNPKDQLVSYYHFLMSGNQANVRMTADKFAQEWMQGKFLYGDYFAHLKVYTIEVVDFTFFAFFRREHFSIDLLGPLESKSKVGTRKPCSKIMHGSIKVIVVMLFTGDAPTIAVKSVLLVKYIRFWLETQLFPCQLRH